MTIGAAWIRRPATGEELWIASDSRLSGDGAIWDDCPKLLSLPRRDAITAFSGSTARAYPLLLQLYNAVASYRFATDGTLDFLHVVGHLERVVNAMMDRLQVDPAIRSAAGDRPDFSSSGDRIILGGFSRSTPGMVLRTLRYQSATRQWQFARVRPLKSLGSGRVLVSFGDDLSQSRFRYLLREALEERGILRRDIAFDFEPLETLAAMLRMPESLERPLPRDRRPVTIGGAPQLVRVIPGARAITFAVRWEVAGEARDFLHGRPALEYEHLDLPLAVFEGTSVQLHAPSRWPTRVREQFD